MSQARRERALEVSLRWMSLALLPVWALSLVQTWTDEIPFGLVLGLILITSPIAALHRARKRLSYACATKLFLCVILATVLYQESLRGFTPGTALLNHSFILLATLLFGDRAFRWAWFACLVNLALGWFLYTQGVGIWIPNAWKLNDPARPLVWIRYAVLLTTLAFIVRNLSRDVRALEQEELLNELGEVLASSLDAQQTMREIGQRMVQHFAEVLVVQLSSDPEPLQLRVTTRGPQQTKLARAVEASLARPTARCDPLEQREELELGAGISVLSASLFVEGKRSGRLIAASASRTYDEQDQKLLEQIAGRITLALENAALHSALQRAHDETHRKLLDLEEAQLKIRTLTGLLPACAWCGRIRDHHDEGSWKRLDQYVMDHTNAALSHTVCPDCMRRVSRRPREEVPSAD
jgi:K+-sensing histidine kinase KdpD